MEKPLMKFNQSSNEDNSTQQNQNTLWFWRK